MFFRHLTGFLRKHGRISKGALRRPNSSLREIKPRRLGRPINDDNVVVTLDPNSFDEKKQKRLHIGDLLSAQPLIRLHNQPSPVRSSTLLYDSPKWRRSEPGEKIIYKLPYPTDTKAFLYYFTSPENPRIAGELRFRVASSDDLASFESGSDLLKANGQLWTRPLFVVSKSSIALYEKLREELLVPDDLDAVLSTFPHKKPNRLSQYLYKVNDPFIVYFSSRTQDLTVITEQGMEKMPFTGPFVEHYEGSRTIPYTGCALVRFERSTLPDHKGTRTVVLRFLKIITAVKCVMPYYNGRIIPPKEGELHQNYLKSPGDAAVIVWSLNVDKKSVMARGLQLLWDI